MNIVADRFIELSILERHRKLSVTEKQEMQESIRFLENLEWKKSKLKNLSLLASMTNDTDWQHELCADLEKFH